MKTKWFYPIQTAAENYLHEKYNIIGYCTFQEICEYNVFEGFKVQDKITKEYTNVILHYNKGTNSFFIHPMEHAEYVDPETKEIK